MSDVRTIRGFSASNFRSAFGGPRLRKFSPRLDRWALKNVIEEFSDGSGRPHQASQLTGAHDQFRRRDHAHVEGQAGRRAQIPIPGQDWHHAPQERQRTEQPRDRHADSVCRSVRRRRRRQNRLLLAPLGKHQRRNRAVVRYCVGNHYGVGRKEITGGTS